MKVVNIMNFARSIEPRYPDVEKKLASATRDQMDLVNRMGVEATFLLQYDVLCNNEFITMIKERAGENIELGFWYEVVEPLTSACGIPYESSNGWRWDWHIKPGFSMAYPKAQREIMIDEAMRKFKEVFGYYPRTVGSWLLDTHTINYLADNYELDALCYCRDQINTDAYTLVGGYFNQAYYPSRNNMFTPAGSPERQNNVPIFRLLGPDPIHNYDNQKYADADSKRGVYTMEIVSKNGGSNPRIVDWYLDNYFNNESLGFAYMQIGQENSFAMFDIVSPLEMQIKKILNTDGVKIEKMCDTGRAFRDKYKQTPATAVCALNNWNTSDTQSVYYDSAHYTANVMRAWDKTFIRSIYLFDDRVEDCYNAKECNTFDAVYENLPIVDTSYQKGDTDGGAGIVLDEAATPFTACKTGDSELTVFWNDKSVTFQKDRILINNCKLSFTYYMVNTKISINPSGIDYEYKGNKYSLQALGAVLSHSGNTIKIEGDSVTLIPTKI